VKNLGYVIIAIMVSLAFGVLAAVTLGCAGVCDQINAQVPAVNARLADAQRAISEVEKSGVREKLSGDSLATFDKALEMAHEGYALAVQSTALASESCSDSRDYIDMIVQAWTIVRPFLALVGGTGTPAIADPIVWVEAQ
jgi:hypothetical protein